MDREAERGAIERAAHLDRFGAKAGAGGGMSP